MKKGFFLLKFYNFNETLNFISNISLFEKIGVSFKIHLNVFNIINSEYDKTLHINGRWETLKNWTNRYSHN